MNLEALSYELGRIVGKRVLVKPLAWYRGRALGFDVTAFGTEHLVEISTDTSFLLVSNHIAASRSELWPLAHLPYFRQYHHSTDSFVFDRIVSHYTGRTIQTVAICGAAWISPRPLRRWIQQRIGQPFARGQMEAMPGYIAVEKQPGAYQRRFLKAIDQTVSRHDPILIFPMIGGSQSDVRLDMGAAHLALKHKLQILPACIVGSESWRAGSKVTVAFGKSFSALGMSKDDINAQIADRITSLQAIYSKIHADGMHNPSVKRAPAAVT